MKTAIKNVSGLMVIGLITIVGWLPSIVQAQVTSPFVSNGGTFNVAVGELLADDQLPAGMVFSAPGNPVLTLVSNPALPANIQFDQPNNRLFGMPMGGVGNYAITVSAPGNADLNFTLVVSNPAATVSQVSPVSGGLITANVSAPCIYTYHQFLGSPPGAMGGLVPATLPIAPMGQAWHFPQGMFDFRVEQCTGGGVAMFIITYSQPLPMGTQYWMFGRETMNMPPHWFNTIPVVFNAARTQVTFQITDGGAGDDFPDPDGIIPSSIGGPAFLVTLPTLSKDFAPDSIFVGGTTTLTFTVVHQAGNPAQSFDFVDNLPAGLVIAANPNVGGTCANIPAAVTAMAGGAAITVANAQITAAQATCTITVDVTTAPAPTIGMCPQAANTNGPANIMGPAVAVLFNNVTDQCVTVNDAVNAALPTLAKAFAPPTIFVGGTTALTFTVAHPAGNPTQTFSFIDNLPAGLVIAANPNVGGTCANIPAAVTAMAGGMAITVANAQITAAQTTCTITVNVVATAMAPTACPMPANTNGPANIMGLMGLTSNVTDQCLAVAALGLPSGTPIPTLSEWMLMLLGLLVVGSGALYMRRHGQRLFPSSHA